MFPQPVILLCAVDLFRLISLFRLINTSTYSRERDKPFFLPKLTLFNEGDTKQASTDKPVALEFQIELEFGNDGF